MYIHSIQGETYQELHMNYIQNSCEMYMISSQRKQESPPLIFYNRENLQ